MYLNMLRSILKSLLFVSLFWIVCGFTIPNYEGYVTDKVGVFSETQKADLTAKIEEIQKTTSIEIAILVVPTVDDDINLAAVDVWNKRWIGKKGQDNGLLLLIAVDDRKWSIQVGYGLEGTLPDLATKGIGEARFPPNFREENYYQGVAEMLNDVLGYIQKDPTIVHKYSQVTTSNSSSNKDNLGFILLCFFIISAFGRWVTVPSVGKKRKMKKYGRWIYFVVWWVLSLLFTWFLASFVVSLFLSYIALLLGILFALFGNMGSRWPGIRFGWLWGGSLWWGSSGFGGFWGGSFGGGGSSGSW